MDGALGWIGWVIEWLGRFIPRLEIIDTRHGAVKWIRGATIKQYGPGWTVYWPFTTKFETYVTARQAADLRSQTLTTSDDVSIVVGGLIIYEIFDIEAILAHTHDPEQTVQDIALTAVHSTCCQHTWEDLKVLHRNGRLDTQLRREGRAELERYGVRILKLTLTDLAKCKVYKLIQSTATDG